MQHTTVITPKHVVAVLMSILMSILNYFKEYSFVHQLVKKKFDNHFHLFCLVAKYFRKKKSNVLFIFKSLVSNFVLQGSRQLSGHNETSSCFLLGWEVYYCVYRSPPVDQL